VCGVCHSVTLVSLRVSRIPSYASMSRFGDMRV
jgi:hypothetical protein